jgi:hypothetical protein
MGSSDTGLAVGSAKTSPVFALVKAIAVKRTDA